MTRAALQRGPAMGAHLRYAVIRRPIDMTVRYNSASARAAGSTDCVQYSRQARSVVLTPKDASHERF